MGFYIRKSFSEGPIRINLSKSGLGVSAGVRGARIGVGPRGAYVAGGRGGLYFRQNLKLNKRSHNNRTTNSNQILVDTGVTYKESRRNHINTKTINSNILTKREKKYQFFLILFVLSLGLVSFSIKMIVIPIIFLVLTIHYYKKDKRIKEELRIVDELRSRFINSFELDKIKEVSSEIDLLSLQNKTVLGFEVIQELIYKYRDNLSQIDREVLESLTQLFALDRDDIKNIKYAVFSKIFNESIEDDFLDKNEEKRLLDYAKEMGLESGTIRDELEVISQMATIRDELANELSPIDIDISIQKSEKCYYETEGKLLNSKILRSYTVDGERIKEVGYVVKKEGSIYLTNKRILLVGNGTYEIRLNKIIDIVADNESNIVEFIVDGKKKPIILTVPNIAVFISKVHKAIEKFV